MLGVKDLRPLDYRHDLTQAGIAYLCRQLQHIGVRRRNLEFNALRQQVAEKAAELALMRYLAAEAVPHEVSAVRSMASRASAIRLGGRPLFLHVQLVSRRRTLESLSRDPAEHLALPLALDTTILEDGQALDGVHIAARVLGEVSKGGRELRQPHFLMVPLPAAWARPASWRPLGELAFKLEAGDPLEVEFGGLDAQRRFVQGEIALTAGERRTMETELFSLSYLRAKSLPGGRLGLHSVAADLQQVLAPKEWGNLWIYGEGITLLGYLPGRELLSHRRGERLLPGEHLQPIAHLLERARARAEGRQTGR